MINQESPCVRSFLCQATHSSRLPNAALWIPLQTLDVGRLEPFVIEMVDRKGFAADAFVQATCCHKFVGSLFP